MDVESAEKKTSQYLTLAELDKKNDYYTQPASPAHTHDSYVEDDYNDRDPYDTYHPETVHMVAPPPPNVITWEERECLVTWEDHPKLRRITPPKTPVLTLTTGRLGVARWLSCGSSLRARVTRSQTWRLL